MSRPAKDSNESIREGLEQVIERVESKKLTWAEVEEAAYRWHLKDYDFYMELAKRAELIPNRLLLFALLMTEHPLIMAENGGALHGGFLYLTALIMEAELTGADVARPPKMDSFHMPLIELKELKESRPVEGTETEPILKSVQVDSIHK